MDVELVVRRLEMRVRKLENSQMEMKRKMRKLGRGKDEG